MQGDTGRFHSLHAMGRETPFSQFLLPHGHPPTPHGNPTGIKHLAALEIATREKPGERVIHQFHLHSSSERGVRRVFIHRTTKRPNLDNHVEALENIHVSGDRGGAG